MRVRLQVAYDGRGFHGFAAQAPGVRTVAGVLGSAVQRVLRLPDPVEMTCAGRTDTGVHAWDQWVHIDVPEGCDVDLGGLQRRLVRLLAPEVVVRSVSVAPPGWDARYSASARTYRYMILNREVPDPFLAGFAWWVPDDLDRRVMDLACDALIGEHDFTSFCRKREGTTLVRRVMSAGWCEPEPGLLRFEITANAFCHQMIRSVVGTLTEVGAGKRRAGEMLSILRAGDRAKAGALAPPDGLVLWRVDYPG